MLYLHPVNDNSKVEQSPAAVNVPAAASEPQQDHIDYARSACATPVSMRAIELPHGWAALYPHDNSKYPGKFAILDSGFAVRAWVEPKQIMAACRLMRDLLTSGENRRKRGRRGV